MDKSSLETIPDVAEIREGLASSMERWRIPVLAGLGIVVVGSLGLLTWGSVRREKVDALRTELHGITDGYFREDTNLWTFSGGFDAQPNLEAAEGQAKKLEEMRPRAAGTEVAPMVLLHLAIRYQVLGQDDRALAVVGELRSAHADSPVMRIQSFDSDRATIVDRIEGISRRRQEFAAKVKFTVPKADPAVVGLVETELGTLKIVFYPDVAPKHVEAFVKQAKAGGFNGTRLYHARRGEWVELGGGARTRNDELRDDREDDPALSVPVEEAARYGVKHRRRMVTSVPLLSGDQADRFAIVLSESRPDFDAVRTPFGEILDDAGAAVADRLGSALVYGEDTAFVDRREKSDYPYSPSRPVLVRRISIWREGALEAGHAWDTARVNTDQPEPEPEAPKPVEPPK
jgi:cyclophilin family peptidyl-prolyl cis-trans isomerase